MYGSGAAGESCELRGRDERAERGLASWVRLGVVASHLFSVGCAPRLSPHHKRDTAHKTSLTARWRRAIAFSRSRRNQHTSHLVPDEAHRSLGSILCPRVLRRIECMRLHMIGCNGCQKEKKGLHSSRCIRSFERLSTKSVTPSAPTCPSRPMLHRHARLTVMATVVMGNACW